MVRRKKIEIAISLMSTLSFVFAMGTKLLYREYQRKFLEKLSEKLMIFAILILVLLICGILLNNKIYKGFRYCWNHIFIRNRLERQMIDAGFGIMRGNYIELPSIKISFDNTLTTGVLRVANKIKFDNRFDNIVMSAGLGKFVVERHYQTDDGNYYIYELIDGKASFRLTFSSAEEFFEYNRKISDYKLFFDKRIELKLHHMLLVGQTGSGKTYTLYSLILQMLNKNKKYNLYFADPKGSSLAVLGEKVAPENTASNIDEIIELLETFVNAMQERKREMKILLESKLDADGSDFGLEPYVFIFDEYASFISVLSSRDKKIRDRVKALLYEIVLMGRQCLFFIVFVMQKSDATIIDTALRDNLPIKVVLGNAETQTYITAFGSSSDVPNRFYRVGEGVFTEPSIAPEPRIIQMPYCKFDILDACISSPRGVTTGAQENKK